LESFGATLHSGLDHMCICIVFHCTKLQELKCKDIHLQISTLDNVMSFCMYAHILDSAAAKISHLEDAVGSCIEEEGRALAICGSFVGGAQIARGVGYPGIRWTRRFMWFGPPERNTLRPWVNGVVLLCLRARLRSSLFSLCQLVCVCGVRPLWLSSARTFYSPRSGSYREAPWPDRWPRGW
jgi:hypothetical protein